PKFSRLLLQRNDELKAFRFVRPRRQFRWRWRKRSAVSATQVAALVDCTKMDAIRTPPVALTRSSWSAIGRRDFSNPKPRKRGHQDRLWCHSAPVKCLPTPAWQLLVAIEALCIILPNALEGRLRLVEPQ